MDDLISRKAAIDAIAELQGRASTKAELKGINKAWKRIKQLSSAQPERKICKGCKHVGLYDDEVQYGAPSPCTGCARCRPDNYEG